MRWSRNSRAFDHKYNEMYFSSFQVLRNPPGDGQLEIVSFIADYLERLVEERRQKNGIRRIGVGEIPDVCYLWRWHLLLENVMDVVTDLTKTDEEVYLDGLKRAHAAKELDKHATIIQVCYNFVTRTFVFLLQLSDRTTMYRQLHCRLYF